MCEDKKLEATIQISIGTCSNFVSDWDKFCSDTGLNPWCMNEGTALSTDMIDLTLEQAKTHGII